MEDFMRNLIIFLILGTLFSCGKSSVESIIPKSVLSEKQRSFVEEIDKYNGPYNLEPIVVKTDTEMGGEWIVIREVFLGMNFGNPDDYIYAYNLADYTPGSFKDFMDLFRSPGHMIEINVDHLGDNRFEGNGLIFESTENLSKDLEKAGAQMEAMQAAEMKDMLVNYGLSSDRAEKLGKMMNSYSKIKNKRGLTSREKDVFTKELTGMSFDSATSVLVEEGYDALVEKASDINGIDPEAVKELLNEVM